MSWAIKKGEMDVYSVHGSELHTEIWSRKYERKEAPERLWLRQGSHCRVDIQKCQSKWPFACRDCGFESRREHGYLSLASIVCCQVQVSASG